MKVFHNTYSTGGEQIATKEITGWSADNRRMWRRHEREHLAKNPGHFFRLSFVFEPGDGIMFENVPEWKSKLAAETLQNAQQVAMAEKLGKRTH